jgi:hypothetical protein
MRWQIMVVNRPKRCSPCKPDDSAIDRHASTDAEHHATNHALRNRHLADIRGRLPETGGGPSDEHGFGTQSKKTLATPLTRNLSYLKMKALSKKCSREKIRRIAPENQPESALTRRRLPKNFRGDGS